MSSGGMDWAYRMVGTGKLDAHEALIVMHLGWRDALHLRTVRAMASALGQHRTTVHSAVQRLIAKGILTRRSGVLVAVETVDIVEGRGPNAGRDPDAKSGAVPSHGTSGDKPKSAVPSDGTRLSRPTGQARPVPRDTIRREKKREGAKSSATAARRSLPEGSGGPPSRVVNGRREYRGPDGDWHRRPGEEREAAMFDLWLSSGYRRAEAEKMGAL